MLAFRTWLNENTSDLVGMAKAAILANCNGSPYIDWTPILIAADAADEAGHPGFAALCRLLGENKRHKAKKRLRTQIQQGVAEAAALAHANGVKNTYKLPWHGPKAAVHLMPDSKPNAYPDSGYNPMWEVYPKGSDKFMRNWDTGVDITPWPAWTMFYSEGFSKQTYEDGADARRAGREPPEVDDAYLRRFIRPATDSDIVGIFAAAIGVTAQSEPMPWE